MTRWKSTAIAALLAALVGCGQQATTVSPEHAALGQKFLLAEEPADAIGILDYREAVLAEAGQAEAAPTHAVSDDAVPVDETKGDVQLAAGEIALVGKIGGGKLAWSDQSASFVLSDPAHDLAGGAGHECHSDNCPFCKGKQAADQGQAIVMLTQENGQVPRIAARKLLPLAEGQMVVVSGRPEVNALGQLVLHARGLYVRR